MHRTIAMAVGSAAVLLAEFESPPPETVAVFVTEADALAATVTTSVIGGKPAPDAKESLRMQEIVANVQFQPVPLIAVAVRLAGNASVTVIVPLLADCPVLIATIVYDAPVWPTLNEPVCERINDRSAPATTG